MTTETTTTSEQFSPELIQQAQDAGFKVEVYAQWVQDAEEEGITIEEYIEELDDETVVKARIPAAESLAEDGGEGEEGEGEEGE